MDGKVCALDVMPNYEKDDTCRECQLFPLSCTLCGTKNVLGCQELTISGPCTCKEYEQSSCLKVKIIKKNTSVEGFCMNDKPDNLDSVKAMSAYFSKGTVLKKKSLISTFSCHTTCNKEAEKTYFSTVMSMSPMPLATSTTTTTHHTTPHPTPALLPLNPTTSYPPPSPPSNYPTSSYSNIPLIGGLVGGVIVLILLLAVVGGKITLLIRRSQ